jgi:hypothetical protein
MSDDEIDDRLMIGVYANECRVGQNLIEFMIDFGQRNPANKVVYHTRIVTTPFGMGEFVATMLEALEAYRKRLGSSAGEEEKQ